MAATNFNEALQSTSLLGAHFGGPGPPGTVDYGIVGGGTTGLTVGKYIEYCCCERSRGDSTNLILATSQQFRRMQDISSDQLPR